MLSIRESIITYIVVKKQISKTDKR